MKKIVVIGGGTMGLDIAQVFARNGYDVVVRDIKDEDHPGQRGPAEQGPG